MTSFRRGSSRVHPTSNRRKTAWADGPGGTTTRAISAPGASFVGAAVQPLAEGLTVARIRGRLDWYLTLATAASDGFQGAFGIGIATVAAVTAGVASVPTPITEQSSENWLYWTPLSAHGAVVSSTALGEETKQSIEIDTKAMRKFPSELSVYAILELVESGTATADLHFDSRMLFFLP